MTEARCRQAQVLCTVDIEQSAEALYAHVLLDDVVVEPGDRVLVHGAPAALAFGEHIVCRRPATVFRAGGLRRWWTRMSAWFALSELYEVGFSPRRNT